MNFVDVIVILLLITSAFRGYRHGFIRQVFELGGGFFGLIVGLALGPQVASWFTSQPGAQGALISLAVVFVALALGQTLGVLVGHRLGTAARDPGLRSLNESSGIAFSLLVTLVSFWLVGSLLVQGPSRHIARALRDSQILAMVNTALPEPPNVLAYIQQYLNTTGFPQVFAGFPRDIGPPVDLPPGRVARRAASNAGASTVQVRTPACGGVQLGSGWVAADSTVVTNAHVVAGGDSVVVTDSAGERPATVVLFDPGADIAVLKTSGLAGEPLSLEASLLDRGTPGATLGYPGARGGQLVVHRAAVQASFDAVGRDIYGRSKVERSVYEIRSPVRQGDSGGPFVLPDGRVAGMIFAASTTDSDTGYALTGPEVQDEVRRGAARTNPVGTGRCTR